MTRGQHTKHHGHRWVIGEEIESRGVEIWDIEEKVAEVEHSKEGDVLCVAAVNSGKQIAPHSGGDANSQGHLQGDGVLS